MKGNISSGQVKHSGNQFTWETQPAISAQFGTDPGHYGNGGFRRIHQANGFQGIQRRMVNLVHLPVAKGPVLTAFHSRADRALAWGNWAGVAFFSCGSTT